MPSEKREELVDVLFEKADIRRGTDPATQRHNALRAYSLYQKAGKQWPPASFCKVLPPAELGDLVEAYERELPLLAPNRISLATDNSFRMMLVVKRTRAAQAARMGGDTLDEGLGVTGHPARRTRQGHA